MKIIYLANARIPTEKAHGLQIMKMVEAFKNQGIDIELVVAKRVNNQLEGINPFNYYDLKTNFFIKKLWLIDLVDKGHFLRGLSVFIQNSSFAFSSFFYLLAKKVDFIYCRDEFSLFLLSFFKKNLILELHAFPQSKLFLYKFIFRRVKKIIVITRELKRLIVNLGITEKKIGVFPDSVDINQFQIKESKKDCRQSLNLPQDKNIILYTGHLFAWKGVYTLAEATRFLSDSELVIFVGGMEYDINKLKVQSSKFKVNNILIVGYRPPKEIPLWLKAADILVLPNSGKKKISQYYTSPMKLFEYLAASKPIIASDLPSIREILNENNSILVPADDPEKLAKAISYALANKELCVKISQQAYHDVLPYSWSNRVKKILNFIYD